MRNLNQILELQNTPHTSRPEERAKGRAMGAFCEDMEENWARYNGSALYMIWQSIGTVKKADTVHKHTTVSD